MATRLLEKAVERHQAGDLAAAQSAYECVLAADPTNADALHLLGVLKGQQGCHAEATLLIQQALRIKPDIGAFHLSLGMTLRCAGRLEAACSSLERATQLLPTSADAWAELGHVQVGLAQPIAALASYRSALRLEPGSGAAWHGSGLALAELGQHQEAVQALSRALASLGSSAEVHCARGVSLEKLGRIADALADYDQAILGQPGHPVASINRGHALLALGRPDEAIQALEGAAEALARSAPGWRFLAAAHREVGSFREALACLERAALLAPVDAKVLTLEALTRIGLGSVQEALACLDRAIALDPKDPEPCWNKALTLLMDGQLQEGWRLHEERWPALGLTLPHWAELLPAWTPESGARRVLAWGEQGLGDQILHASMVEDLAGRCEELTLLVDRRLVGLFRRSMPRVRVRGLDEGADPIDFDSHIALGSLGRHFRPNLADVWSRSRAFLAHDEARASVWRARLAPRDEMLIGVSWHSANARIGRHKSIQLVDFHGIFEVPGVQVVNLQYGATRSERALLQARTGHRLLHVPEVDPLADIDAFASLIGACDLIVSVSNTTVHLAGAMGKPVKVLIPANGVSLWYWRHQQGSRSLWYPDVELFTQAGPGDWSKPLGQMLGSVRAFATAWHSSRHAVERGARDPMR